MLSPQTRSQSLEKVGKKNTPSCESEEERNPLNSMNVALFPSKPSTTRPQRSFNYPTHTKGDQSLCLFDKSGRDTSFHTQIILFSPQTPKPKVRVKHKTNKISANSSPTSRQLWRGPRVDALIPAWRIRSSENRVCQSPNGADGDFHISKLQEEKN